eukprot:gene1582-3057_t
MVSAIFLLLISQLNHISNGFIDPYHVLKYLNIKLNYRDLRINVKKEIPDPSKEQRKILQTIMSKLDVNLVVNAVAGSGKTTTVLQLADANRNYKILLLTYNSKLKEETRAKKKEYKLDNLEVHSYHAYAVKYYDRGCYTSRGILKVINEGKLPITLSPSYDIIAIDEAQDMTSILYKFVCKMLFDLYTARNISPRLLIFGDENQELYSFNGADRRYLTHAYDLFKNISLTSEGKEKKTKDLTLKTSYRISGNIAKLINQGFLGGEQRITANKGPGEVVDYIIGCPWKAVDGIAADIFSLLRQNIYKPDDIFILVPSLKFDVTQIFNSTTRRQLPPFKYLENLLCDMNIPIFIPLNDDSEINEEHSANKVIFSTFHQSKGLEREFVVVFSFSNDYFNYYAKNENRFTCPSTLYVALTRAKSKLVIVAESVKGDHAPFVDRDLIEHNLSRGYDACVNIINNYTSGIRVNVVKKAPTNVTVTQLIKYIPDTLIMEVMSLLKWKCTRSAGDVISIPCDIHGAATSHGGKESVADLNGLVIPSLLEEKSTGNCTLRDVLSKSIKSNNSAGHLHAIVIQKFNELKPPKSKLDTTHFIKLALLYSAVISDGTKGFISRLKQIKKYNWITKEIASSCVKRLESAVYEDDSSGSSSGKLHKYKNIKLNFEAELSSNDAMTNNQSIPITINEYDNGRNLDIVIKKLVQSYFRNQGRSIDADFLKNAENDSKDFYLTKK